ncbi:MAG: hypothetical protein JSV99_04105 [Planctomycetota bacterium]|nr:MAG: hypothetical protein JSV99_04105 [Planctomycetota bacterium]
MKRRNNKLISVKVGKTIPLILFMLLFSLEVFGDYEIVWSTIDGGGGVSSGGEYIVTGTIGQADAAYSAGGQYEVLGGFWPGGPLCTVEFGHYARFADYWLSSGCDADNEWCGGADLDQMGDVDGLDLGLFVEEWLYWCPYDWPLK